MENNLENKSKFFAQYYGQYNVIRIKGWGRTLLLDSYKFLPEEKTIEKSFLELKPISSITDEDAKKIGFGNRNSFIAINKEKYVYHFENVDYLRSKGYALPWIGLSVETMVEWGWIKLI